jgi:hypothetical protein
MSPKANHGGRGGWIALGALLILSGSMTALESTPARAATYLGAELVELKPEDRVAVAHRQPVQLLFQFQTKGAPNGRATKMLKKQVTDVVKASGLFSDISDDPTPNGAILSVQIDDLADAKDTSDAESKGFVTGATFFVAGSTVRDKYQCNVDYVAGPTAPKISKVARQTLYFQMGLINHPPEGAVKIGGLNDAVMTMVRQVVANPLNEVAKDPGFQIAEAPAPAATPTVAADAVVPAPSTAPAASVASAAQPQPAAPTATPAPDAPTGAPAPAQP